MFMKPVAPLIKCDFYHSIKILMIYWYSIHVLQRNVFQYFKALVPIDLYLLEVANQERSNIFKVFFSDRNTFIGLM